MQERLYLLDGMALAYRAYFSMIARPLINSKGVNTSAIYGFVLSLMKILDEHPDHIAVVFDTPQPTFRHKLFPEYKATRQKMPEDLAASLKGLKEVVQAFNTPIIELPGFEADDVIGTLARRAEKEKVLSYLVTGDKDFMQLISPLIKMYKPGKSGSDIEIVEEAGVREKFGVLPEQVIDVLGLIGDKSDNVPGVPGIGEKTAIPLIQKYGNMDELYLHIDEIPQKGVREKLQTHKELALLSRKLVTIDTNAPVPIDFHQLRSKPRDVAKLKELFTELEFKSFVAKLDAEKASADGPSAPAEIPAEDIPVVEPVIEVHSSATDCTTDRHTYHTIATMKELKDFCAHLRTFSKLVIDTETTSKDATQAHLVGLSFCGREREAYYIPVCAEVFSGEKSSDLFGGELSPDAVPLGHLKEALDWKVVLPLLRPILEDPHIGKIGQNIKYDFMVLQRHGIAMQGILFDTMVGSYIVRADGQHNLDALALGAFNYRMISYEDLTGKGKTQKRITKVPLERLAEYSSEDADLTMRLYEHQMPELERLGLMKLCDDIEFPLIAVLARMELTGISLDIDHLAGMAKEMERQMQGLIIDIHRDAGGTFNINSTQQLGEILFNRLNLPAQRKTKTGFSTDVSVLESLRGQHPIIEKLLEFRQLSKLKSTYVDALPSLLNPITGRIHTSFNQTVAATGRLSSSDPNLQNIPIRTEAGRAIRKAFVPAAGMTLVSADYSQIELRIMAHISNDAGLVEAFTNGEDIHASTAAKVFGVDQKDITRDMRRKAKEVNFGIMYGIGPFGLGSRLGIPQSEAREIIERYFQRFPGVKEYIHETIKSARDKGYASTLFGRRRYFPEITSRNQTIRANAERAAINMPIQGTAADMIKVAMIHIDADLLRSNNGGRLLLQVHDELVLESPFDIAEALAEKVRERMQNALQLNVPVLVEVGMGKNWLEAH